MTSTRSASPCPTRCSPTCGPGCRRPAGRSARPCRTGRQGVPLAYLREFCAYWAEKYDWRAREAALNAFPQFTTTIDELDLHFFHSRSPHAERAAAADDARLAGLGRRVRQGDRAADRSRPTAAADDAFHVVAPSLPGFGFSGKPTTPGWGVRRIADAWCALMAAWATTGSSPKAATGARPSPAGSARRTPTGCSASTSRAARRPDPARRRRRPAGHRAIAASKHYQRTGLRLRHAAGHQAADARVRPHRLPGRAGGVDLGEVPGVDRLRRPPGERASTATRCSTRSRSTGPRRRRRRRRGSTGRASTASRGCRSTAPTAVAAFPKEILRVAPEWAARRYNIVRWTDMPRGGHFAGLEQPELLVDDIRAAARAWR